MFDPIPEIMSGDCSEDPVGGRIFKPTAGCLCTCEDGKEWWGGSDVFPSKWGIAGGITP